MYSLEEKCERNLYYNGSWQLPHFIWAVLTDWLLPTHSEHWQHSQSVLLSLDVGQTKHLSRRLSLFFLTVIGEAVCLQGTSLALTALQLCLLTFPLSALLLISGLIISSPRDGWYRHIMALLLLPIRIHQHTQSNARTRAASIKLKNSFKCRHLVDLVHVYFLTNLSIASIPLLMVVPCMVMSGLWSFSSPMHFSSCRKDDHLVYCCYTWYQCLVTSKTKDRRIDLSFFFVKKPTRCTNFTNFSWNSTCFGQFVCPSSGVYSPYTQQWYMSYRFIDSFRAGPR